MASVAAATPLSPEIRLAQAVSEFVAGLSDEQKRSFRTQQENFSPPTIPDAIRVTVDIDRIAGKTQKGNTRTFGPRLTNFLHAVQKFASLGDDVLGASLSLISGSVWLIVRFTLELEKISEMFMNTGRSAPRYMEIGFFYSSSMRLRSSFQEYFVTAVHICHYLVNSLRRSVLADTLFSSTDSILRGYESDLQKWAVVVKEELPTIQGQISSAHIDSYAGNLTDFPEPGSKTKNLLPWPDSKSTKVYLRYDNRTPWKRIKGCGSTDISTLSSVYETFVADSDSSTLLYSGVAGAGKSVILANLVEDLIQKQSVNANILFFFCCWNEIDSLQALTILGSLCHQVLKDIPDGPPLEGSLTVPSDAGEVATLLHSAIQVAVKTYIVLDGLDQCKESERAKVIEVLQSLQPKCSLSICLSSRRGVLTGTGWTNLHSIDIPTDNREVSSYINSELSRRLESGELVVGYPALALQIRSALTTAAKGNFVWSKRMIELLCEQKTDSDITRLLAGFRDNTSDGIDTEIMQSILPTSAITVAPSSFTDSAYASASLINGNNKNTNDGPAVGESLQGPEHLVIDDSATEYSDVSCTTFSRKQLYIQELAKDLHEKVGFCAADLSKDHRVDISATLPCLLKAFALKIGYCATTQMHRDVMAFVHRHRSEITAAFLDVSLSQSGMDSREIARPTLGEVELMDGTYPSIEPQEIRDESGSMSLNERMALWEQSYSWLLTQLQRDMDSVLEEPTAIQLIRDQVLCSVPSPHRISRSVSPHTCTVVFELDWNILEFFYSQEYSTPPHEVLPEVITVTGSSSDAQASNCAQFLKQTWPVTGDIILQLIRDLLRLERGHRHQSRLPDGTMLAAWINNSKLMVQTEGPSASISETGEVIAWLGAALRSSPLSKGLSSCTPTIRSMHTDAETPQAIVCEIGFKLDKLLKPTDNTNGHCWHGRFKNPIVVDGFPILPKLEKNTGLEIPLNIMAGLARADRVDQFNDKVYIKGFSTILVPTKQCKEVVYWHLIYKEDGSRISYLDDNLNRDAALARSPDLSAHRHVLGWCSEARFYAAQYHVRHSELPKPQPGCALAGTMITLGRMITGGHSFQLGIKDTPVHAVRNGYIPRLKWISSKFFLLWDEGDKRGWLTNGTSALLHVVRASLAYDSSDKFRSAFIFKSEDLQESPKPFTADSAINVLINPKNLALKLYPEKDGFIVLRDRIDQYYNLLEKMLDHQTDLARRHTGSLERMPRKHLEGWDFEDLSANRDPLHPRLVTVETIGKGWVDLTKAFEAVTPTGRGFGELVRPVGSDLCEYWYQLPTQRYLIACCVSDIQDVIRDHRSYKDDFTRLSDDLIWHNAVDMSAQCQCGCVSGHHGEPVNVLFPSALSHKLCTPKGSVSVKRGGAVVFGHNRGFSWVWGDDGLPTQQKLEEQVTVGQLSDRNDKDSGVGASLVASSSDDHGSSMPSSSISSPPSPLKNLSRPRSTSSTERKAFARDQYTVGILCPLSIELKAIRALFDRRHQSLARVLGDNNQYALGEMAQHMIVATSLPAGEYGTNAAASAMSDLMRSFTSLQFCLLVGIAGGAPSDDNDIRLGDVVVSLPTNTFPGVIQYDLGKENEGSEFEVRGVLQRPPRILANAISKLHSELDIEAIP
ncbi:nucleoside phosphorylase [Fusarium bulbicola]|nr:nucleoside phosphorylase [Fusarium bulbicola]